MQDAYFQQLNKCLKKQGNGQPQLIVDVDQFEQNLRHIASQISAYLKPRLVVKSLANLYLMQSAAKELKTQAFMLFHLPHILKIKAEFKDSDLLMGKPMPIQALDHLFKQNREVIAEVQWLIDSEQRLEQYLNFAHQHHVKLKLNLEIDIGLHRGGFNDLTLFKKVLKRMTSESDALTLSGLMGYDAHVSKLPSVLFSTIKNYQKSQQRYQQFIQVINDTCPDVDVTQLCLNGAGSGTLQYHCTTTVCNDVSFGSLLMKPLDFEIAGLEQLKPALWIACPVLKKLQHIELPGLELFDPFAIQPSAICIYGGYWRGVCEYPKGAKPHSLYGRSSNQELLKIPSHCHIEVDDYVFIRPAQSEAIIPQFEHLYIYDGNSLEPHINFRE